MKNSPYFYSGNFGLERETLRVDKNGRLSVTPHPFDSKYITRDFCENQIEIITPVCGSTDEMLDKLGKLDSEARAVLDTIGERIWLYSNPPHFETENDIPIAAFDGEQSSKRSYREKLQRRYGKRLMLFSGIHFNFSFGDDLLHALHKGSALTFGEFRDRLYLRLYKQLSRYSWLLVLLTAASPVYDLSLDEDYAEGVVLSRYSSMRNSERGYWNEFVPVLDHTDLKAYTESIQNYVNKGMLFSPSELYLPIRMKPRGANTLENLAENGVDHIELRMFDLNPLEPLGINRSDLKFAHLLILYLISLDDFEYTEQLQYEAVENHRSAALYDLRGITVSGRDIIGSARDILDSMKSFFSSDKSALNTIDYELGKLADSSERVCERVIKRQLLDVL